MYKKILIIIPIIFSSLTFAENLKLPTSYSNDLYNEIILSGDYDKKIDHPSNFLILIMEIGLPHQVKSIMQLILIRINLID